MHQSCQQLFHSEGTEVHEKKKKSSAHHIPEDPGRLLAEIRTNESIGNAKTKNQSNDLKCTNLEGQRVQEQGQEPVESDGRDVNVQLLHVLLQIWKLGLYQFLQDLLISLSTAQHMVVVVAAEVFLRQGHQQPSEQI